MTLMKTYQNYIDGAWKKPKEGRYTTITDPADGRAIARVPSSTAVDVRDAVASARKAFDSGVWSEKTPAERSLALWRLADLIEKDTVRLARVESRNQGKSIKYARDSDLPFIVDNLRFFAGAARMLEGKAAAEYSGMGTSMVRREPVGVVAGIIPWNYPLMISVWKFAPAIAAGNTVVLKPASLTPLSLLEICELTKKAGIPDGVFNVITGSGETAGDALCTDPDIDIVAFTGSTETGKRIMEKASSTVKRISLELGGKAPMVVMPDANLDVVANGAVVGGFWNGGQDCTAVTRVYVHKKQHDALVRKMVALARTFRLDDQLKESTDMGPLVSEAHRKKIESYVELARRERATVECGGKRPSDRKLAKGCFFEPTVLTGVAHHSRVCTEEIFGPVICVFSYTDVDEAVKRANDVHFGLAASVYGKDVTQAMSIARRLRFGTVWINEHGVLASEMPHGGFKRSGFGKDLSIYSFGEYTNIKHVYVDSTGLARRPWHYTVFGEKGR